MQLSLNKSEYEKLLYAFHFYVQHKEMNYVAIGINPDSVDELKPFYSLLVKIIEVNDNEKEINS